MVKRKCGRTALIFVVANTVCWLAFLALRSPLPIAEFLNDSVQSSADPRIVAERPVWPHGDLALDLYQVLSLPPVLAGTAVDDLVGHVLWKHGDRLPTSAIRMLSSRRSRSWLLAGLLFVFSSAYWAAIGALVGWRRIA